MTFPCPRCGAASDVKDTKLRQIMGGYDAIYRRRHCRDDRCGHRWVTWETQMAGNDLHQKLKRTITTVRQAASALVKLHDELIQEEVGVKYEIQAGTDEALVGAPDTRGGGGGDGDVDAGPRREVGSS